MRFLSVPHSRIECPLVEIWSVDNCWTMEIWHKNPFIVLSFKIKINNLSANQFSCHTSQDDNMLPHRFFCPASNMQKLFVLRGQISRIIE